MKVDLYRGILNRVQFSSPISNNAYLYCQDMKDIDLVYSSKDSKYEILLFIFLTIN